MNTSSFSALPLNRALLENLESLGYLAMTPIQAQSLPFVLAGKDVIGQGKTGSGKTAAFGLGLLNQLDVSRFAVQALVICPTRELADQVAKEIRRLARSIPNVKVLTLCGGMPFGPQIGSLEHGAHIVVGTPGRLEEHLRKKTLVLDGLKSLVLDEADRMLDMGFQAAIDAIIDYLPSQRQTLLFSATYPPQIESIAQRVLRSPEIIQVESTHENVNIKQYFYKVESEPKRLQALQLVLHKFNPESAVIFCSTKRETQEVTNALVQQGFAALALHGDLEQRDRDQTLVRFSNKSAALLVATDVAARGLDIDSLDMVINYQPARDAEVHVHRIGRTGRAGKNGVACTLATQKDEFKMVKLREYLDADLLFSELPRGNLLDAEVIKPAMITLQIDGGKKQKIRAGDILGALTASDEITADHIGKISIFDQCAYIAVDRKIVKAAMNTISKGKIKGRSFRVRSL